MSETEVQQPTEPDARQAEPEHYNITADLIEHRFLRMTLKCPRCGRDGNTDDPRAVATILQNGTVNTTCSCGAKLCVTRKLLITPNAGPNRHDRRAGG